MARSLSLSLCEKTSIHPDSCLVTFWSSDENRFLLINMFKSLPVKPLICHLRSFFPRNSVSFFVWLVSLPGIWHGVSPSIWFGLSIFIHFMSSSQDNGLSSSRFPDCLVRKAFFLGKTCVYSIWKIPCARNNGPNDFHKWLRFLLKVFLRLPCDISCCKFSWARWCLVVWIFFQNDGVDCHNLSAVLNFVRARSHPNQYLKVFRARHFHINARASSSVVYTQFLDWLIFACRIHPHLELVGLSTSPQGLQNLPKLFLFGLAWRHCPIFRVSA